MERPPRRGRPALGVRHRPGRHTLRLRPRRRSRWLRFVRRIAAARRRSTRGGARSTWPWACSRAVPPYPRPKTSSCATRGMRRRLRSAGGPATRATQAAFYAYAHPAPDGFELGHPDPDAARWEPALGEYILDWDDVCASPDPHAAAVGFARSAFQHACAVCEWDPALAATAQGTRRPSFRRDSGARGRARRRSSGSARCRRCRWRCRCRAQHVLEDDREANTTAPSAGSVSSPENGGASAAAIANAMSSSREAQEPAFRTSARRAAARTARTSGCGGR